jgi:hypothetical protein
VQAPPRAVAAGGRPDRLRPGRHWPAPTEECRGVLPVPIRHRRVVDRPRLGCDPPPSARDASVGVAPAISAGWGSTCPCCTAWRSTRCCGRPGSRRRPRRPPRRLSRPSGGGPAVATAMTASGSPPRQGRSCRGRRSPRRPRPAPRRIGPDRPTRRRPGWSATVGGHRTRSCPTGAGGALPPDAWEDAGMNAAAIAVLTGDRRR